MNYEKLVFPKPTQDKQLIKQQLKKCLKNLIAFVVIDGIQQDTFRGRSLYIFMYIKIVLPFNLDLVRFDSFAKGNREKNGGKNGNHLQTNGSRKRKLKYC